MFVYQEERFWKKAKMQLLLSPEKFERGRYCRKRDCKSNGLGIFLDINGIDALLHVSI